MGRKIIAWILTGIISVLLITGCSSQGEGQNVSNEDTTTETVDKDSTILPSDVKIGIIYAEEDGEFTESFVEKLKGYLVSSGVAEDNIEASDQPGEELQAGAGGQIAAGCHVLFVGNADAAAIPAITDAASKAEIPVVFFGTGPDEKELQRWEKKGIKAVYVGGTCEKAAQKRADVLDAAEPETIDQNGDEEIGLIVLGKDGISSGDLVNEETLKAFDERGYAVNVLTDGEDESGEGDTEESAEEAADEAAQEPAAEPAQEPEEEQAVTNGPEAEAEAENAGAAQTDEEIQEEEEEEPISEARLQAKENVIRLMDEYGKDLEVILCANDDQALGAWDAISEEKKKVGHDVIIFGFDANRASVKEVASGNIRSTFFNDFLEQSKSASDAAFAFLRGDSVQPCIYCEYVNVTVDNAQEIFDIMQNSRKDVSSDAEQKEAE